MGDYSGDLEFLNYSERWGNSKSGCGILESISGECILNDGPTGPMMKGNSNPGTLNLD